MDAESSSHAQQPFKNTVIQLEINNKSRERKAAVLVKIKYCTTTVCDLQMEQHMNAILTE